MLNEFIRHKLTYITSSLTSQNISMKQKLLTSFWSFCSQSSQQIDGSVQILRVRAVL